MSTLGENIRRAREKAGITQDELAQKLGYKTRSSIAKIENGTNDIPQSKIVSIANALNTTPSELMGWDRELDELDWKVLELYPNYNPQNGYISDMICNEHEKEVLAAYRKSEKPLRDGIDRMLGVEPIINDEDELLDKKHDDK